MPIVVVPLSPSEDKSVSAAAAWGGLSRAQFAARCLPACADHARAAHFFRDLAARGQAPPSFKLIQVVETFETMKTTTDFDRPPHHDLEWVTEQLRDVLPTALISSVSGELSESGSSAPHRLLQVPVDASAHHSIRRAAKLADRRISSWARDSLVAGAHFARVSRDMRELGDAGPSIEEMVDTWLAWIRAVGSIQLGPNAPDKEVEILLRKSLLQVAEGPNNTETVVDLAKLSPPPPAVDAPAADTADATEEGDEI